MTIIYLVTEAVSVLVAVEVVHLFVVVVAMPLVVVAVVHLVMVVYPVVVVRIQHRRMLSCVIDTQVLSPHPLLLTLRTFNLIWCPDVDFIIRLTLNFSHRTTASARPCLLYDEESRDDTILKTDVK